MKIKIKMNEIEMVDVILKKNNEFEMVQMQWCLRQHLKLFFFAGAT
jgi:hypothetical protein